MKGHNRALAPRSRTRQSLSCQNIKGRLEHTLYGHQRLGRALEVGRGPVGPYPTVDLHLRCVLERQPCPEHRFPLKHPVFEALGLVECSQNVLLQMPHTSRTS